MPVLAELPHYMKQKPVRWDEDKWGGLLDEVGGNVEHLLTLIAQSQPWLGEADNLEHRAEFLRFTTQLGALLDERQSAAIALGDCPAWLTTLVERWAKEPCAVITFNYDTLVEKVYNARLPGSPENEDRSKRTVHDLYVTPFAPIGQRNAGMTFGGRMQAAIGFPLLKLHGSINWYYSGSPNSTGEVLYYIEPGNGWVPSEQPKGWEAYERAPDKVPFIVPPTTDKSSFMSHESILTQWREARFNLEQSSDVYFLGYSLPETDLMVRFMLQHAFKRFTWQNKVVVVNKAVGPNGESRTDEVEATYRSLKLPDGAEVNTEFVRDDDVMADFVDAYVTGGFH